MSALTNDKGAPSVLSSLANILTGAPAGATAGLIDASTEKVAFIGSVWHPTTKTGTINIRKVHWLAGAISSFNAASNFRVSIQSVSATAGPPYQPNGTIKGTGNNGFYSYGAGVSPTASAWNTTGAFGADVAVDLSADSLGDTNSRWIAVVFDYTAFTSTTSVNINLNSNASGVNANDVGNTGGVLFTGTWALIASAQPIVVLECDDGTFAFMSYAVPFSAWSSVSVSSSAAIRRAGLKFKVPTERKLDRFLLQMAVPDVSDGRLVLYDSDGTTELRSVDIDNDAVVTASVGRGFWAVFEPVTLAADTYYRFVFVGGTTTAATVYYQDVNAAGHMDGLPGGQEMHWTQADSTPTWTDTTTRRPNFVLGFSAFHDGAGGGGLAANPIAGFVA